MQNSMEAIGRFWEQLGYFVLEGTVFDEYGATDEIFIQIVDLYLDKVIAEIYEGGVLYVR